MIWNRLYFSLTLCLLTTGENPDDGPAVSPAPSEPPTDAHSEAPSEAHSQAPSEAPSKAPSAAPDHSSKAAVDHLNGPFTSAFLPQDCGTTRYDNASARIIQGEQARLGQFPWMARLGLGNGKQTLFFCGGSIINRHYVISAAHCTEIPILLVRVGDNYVETDKDCDTEGLCALPHQDIKVKSMVEPDFCFSDMTNDLLLVELERPIEFNEFVRPICLTSDIVPRHVLEKGHMTISGWGYIQSDPLTQATHLMYITAPLVPNGQCNSLFNTRLLDNQICVGYPSGKDSCGGDSGGPVSKDMVKDGQRRVHLIGAVSYGLENCGGGPAVYTSVPHFLSWILEHIKKD